MKKHSILPPVTHLSSIFFSNRWSLYSSIHIFSWVSWKLCSQYLIIQCSTRNDQLSLEYWTIDKNNYKEISLDTTANKSFALCLYKFDKYCMLHNCCFKLGFKSCGHALVFTALFRFLYIQLYSISIRHTLTFYYSAILWRSGRWRLTHWLVNKTSIRCFLFVSDFCLF